MRDILLREHSRSTGESLAATRAAAAVERDTPPIHASDNDDEVDGEMDDHDEMLDAFQAGEDARRSAMGALGARAVAGLHGPRDEAASTLEAARGSAREALGSLYARLRGPRNIEEARAMDSAIEAPRRHERGRGSDELF